MDRPIIVNTKKGPERIIQDRIIYFLRAREWFVVETHGNMFQRGLADLFATHRKYGQRWIEVKQATGYSFTAAQLENFPLFVANGSGIWILCDATEDEYQKLFKEPNWGFYLMLLNQRGCQ